MKDRTLFETAIPSGLRADPIPDVRSILDDFNWFIEKGYVTQKFDLNQYIDLGPVKEAIKQVGPAK